MGGSNGSNGAHDTLPPSSCPGPYLCDGLQALVVDVGIMREQLERIEANQSMLIADVRKVLLALGLRS